LIPRATRRIGGWWPIATLIAIFPANLHMALHPEEFPKIRGGAVSLWARLPVQAVFVAWVRGAMRRQEAPSPTTSTPRNATGRPDPRLLYPTGVRARHGPCDPPRPQATPPARGPQYQDGRPRPLSRIRPPSTRQIQTVKSSCTVAAVALLAIVPSVAQAAPSRHATARPAAGWQPKAVGEQLSLESYTQQGPRVRSRDDGSLYLGTVDGMTEFDASDANFRKRAGRSNANCSSFESVKWPRRFLRRHGTQIALVGGGFIDPSFDADATFCRNSQQRYESASLPGYFLRRSGSQLVLSRVDALNDYSSLTDTIFFERDPETLRLRPDGGFQVDAEGNQYSTAYGPCTGTTPFLGQARTTFVQTVLLHDQGTPRVVVGAAISTPFWGTYPWIRATNRPDRFIFKLERGVNLCA
jgi:Alpha-L-arabinofuranosidase B (ABFB) domain